MPYTFVCDHCGKKFERETPEAKECPFCFWTSSVKREDELLSEKDIKGASSQKAVSNTGRKLAPENWKYLIRMLAFFAILAAAGFLGFKIYRGFFSQEPEGIKAFSIKPSRDAEAVSAPSSGFRVEDLTPQEKEVLYREVSISSDRLPSTGEEAILSRVVPFQTGWAEKLPSAAWTLEQYQKMIADQEAFYKMPFSRSYKKKLEELFTGKYLAASDAFSKGDVLSARNLWLESLAFPLYSTDLKKHRAVALTMLRPFINDTLAKISAMNQSLTDRDKRVREEALSGSYQNLGGLLAEKKWTEALSLIDPMTAEIALLRKDTKTQAVPPPYPASFATIDADLQRPLIELMTPAPASSADLQPLQQDLIEKKEVLETFTETYVKEAAAAHQTVLALICEERWAEAAEALGSIQGPPELQQDAADKMAVLGKILHGGSARGT